MYTMQITVNRIHYATLLCPVQKKRALSAAFRLYVCPTVV